MNEKQLTAEGNLALELPGPQHELRFPDKGNLLEFWHKDELVAFFDQGANFKCLSQDKLTSVLKEVPKAVRESMDFWRQLRAEELKAKYPWLRKEDK